MYDKMESDTENVQGTESREAAGMHMLCPSSERVALLLMPPSFTCYVSGFCGMTVLRGKISINGSALRAHSARINVSAPAWTPALPLETSAPKGDAATSRKSPSNKHTLQKALKRVNMLEILKDSLATLDEGTLLANTTWVMVEGIPDEEQEWMVAAEVKELYKERSLPKGQLVFLSSAVVACEIGMDALGIHQLIIPPSWVNAVSNMESLCRTNESSKLLVCGAKGVGKSSCLRYTINRMLSKSKVICLLDCDVGQPECSPPGVLGLHLLTSPILAPSHLNLQRPILSYYHGDVTSKSGPDRFIAAVQALVNKYQEIQDAFASGAGAEYLIDEAEVDTLRKKREVLSSNPFAVFEDGFEEDDSPTSLPLVVNTDGYIRYMGAEVLGAVVDAVNPDKVFHIVTDKDKYLPALMRYLVPVADEEAHGKVSSGQIAAGEEKPPKYKEEVASLVPGKWSASNISAVDLRSLRLVSYFLRHNDLLMASVHSPSSLHPVPWENAVHIRNGALVDRNGAIATALCSESAYGIPHAQTVMCCLGASDIPSRLIPSVLNGGLVGVLGASASSAHDGSSSVNPAIKTADPLVPCLGMGVVRHLDAQDQRIYVIIPRSSSSAGRLHANVTLAKGALQLPISMTYSPLMPVHCYSTGESAGDGSSKMSHRNNVKRRRGAQGPT